jgi:hypothetical protein
MGYKVLTLKTLSGYDLLAWSKSDISKRNARRLTKKFRNDIDVVTPVVFDWYRFYDTITEMKKDLPKV